MLNHPRPSPLQGFCMQPIILWDVCSYKVRMTNCSWLGGLYIINLFTKYE